MIVVKVGGNVIARNLSKVVESISRRAREGSLVVVHGGGSIVTDFCRRVGVEPKFVTSPDGVRSRYTDRDELEVYVMVMAGKINKEIVSGMVLRGVKSIGITGADGPTLIAERKKRIVVIDERGRKRVIEGGYTGRIVEVRADFINLLLGNGFTVVIAPIAIDNEGNLLNVDADQVAFKLSSALKVDKLIILTDVPGLLIDGNVVRSLNVSEVSSVISKVGTGMNRKLIEAVNAIESGVKEVVISSGLVDDPLTHALEGYGTVITS